MQKLVAPGGITNSTSDTVKAKCKCPCLIVRPAVRGPLTTLHALWLTPGLPQVWCRA